MSNGDTRSESAPASNGVARADDRAHEMASVVERALAVLREHGARAPTVPAARVGEGSGASLQSWALDPSSAPGVLELHRQLERLRNQAQDLVDELVRMLESSATSAATGASPLTALPVSPDVATGSVPGLAQLQRVVAVAGQASSMRFRLANDMPHAVEVLLTATSLVGPKGFEVPSRYVGFSPNPLVLAASAAQPVDLTIRMPEQVPPGEYSGLVQGVGLEGASARLTIEVKPATGAS